MPAAKLPADVRSFIERHLSSIEQLEILCLIFGTMAQEWTVEAVYRSVLTNVSSVEQCLARFVACGFLEKSRAVPATYRPQITGDARDTAPELCRSYREMPSRVIEAIYQKDRQVVQDFADAFKIKRQS